MTRQQWFIDRIGKRIWRNRTSCGCERCQDVYRNGLMLLDRDHAIYACDMENSYNSDGIPLRYFDTEKERDQFEKTLK